MTGRIDLVVPGLLSLALLGCRPVPGQRPQPRDTPPPTARTPPAAGAPLASQPEPASVPEPPRCRPAAPEPAIAPVAPGPAYVLVEHVGVVRIDGGEATTVMPLAKGTDARELEMTAGPDGALWLSGWQGVDVLAPGGSLRTIRRRADKEPRYEHLIVRANDDVWAVTSDIEWQLVHYDGSRWRPVRRRKQFPGRYEDNKFAGLAVTSEGVWVSSWNGLWRGSGADWRHIDGPAGSGILSLWTYRDRVIAGDHTRWFLRDGADWRPLAWPETTSVLRAVGAVGLVAAPEYAASTVTLVAATTPGCTATSEPLTGSGARALAVDGSGRVWLANDIALGVIDGDGSKLAEWTAGTLPGLSGRVTAIAVIGAGPQRLPAARPARTWEVIGRLKTYKSGAPLANAAVELCPGPATDRCPPGPSRRTATSAADGSFRFADVTLGDYSIVVRPPAAHPDCDSPFTDNGHSLAPAVDCPPDSARCDLGPLTDCLPFEMPPPLH